MSIDGTIWGVRVTKEFDRAVRIRAAQRRMNKSDAIREAVTLWLNIPTCPCCDGPTFAKDGIRYCSACNMAVEVATQ